MKGRDIVEKDRKLLEVLMFEKTNGIKGGIYNKLQVDFAYNSNHIEGSKLSHDQTRYIYETSTVGIEPARINDIFEAVNHFRCFDYVLDKTTEPLTAGYIKDLHRILKSGVIDENNEAAVAGDYKKYPNFVGNIQTAAPSEVANKIDELIKHYESINKITFYEILDFHASFEKIHPFYDGNGRVGRLLMFKECLRNDIVPFFIDDVYKGYYYRGLSEWQTGGEKGYLTDTCLMMQDNMKNILDYFKISYETDEAKNDPETKK